MTGALSPTHWLIILVVLVVLFGAKRLPDTARGLGKAMRIFKAETAALSDGDRAATGTGTRDDAGRQALPQTSDAAPGATKPVAHAVTNSAETAA